jgi:predicted nucleic acid-binding protein
MRDRMVLDSSVIATIFFKDEDSLAAEKAVENHSPITVDTAMAEVANVAWKKALFFDEPKSAVFRAMLLSRDFILNVCQVIPAQELLEDAFEIALENRITIYDSLFVAASERTKAPLLTADRKLYERKREIDNVIVV